MLQCLHSFDDPPETAQVEEEPFIGLFGPARSSTGADDSLTDLEREHLEIIRDLGYLSGYEEAPIEEGVVLYDTTQAFNGYNIIISGHGPGVVLVDMEGEVVHEWYNPEVTLYGLWPDAQDQTIPMTFWRRAYLGENGELTVMIQSGGVVRVDRESNVIWQSDFLGCHHDIDRDQNGNTYTIGRYIHENPDYFPDKQIAEDYIVVLDSVGRQIQKLSTLDVLANSHYAPLLRRMPDGGDVLHCNTIEYIRPDMLPEDYSGPLRPNTVLLSHRAIDVVCAVDLQEESVYWAESDLWHMQHQPTVMPNGTMMVFDNQGMEERSTVLQFDPATDDVTWFYRGTEEEPFYSVGSGSCHRLPNANTLIAESMEGRAFEVNPEKEIVWEFYNPHRAGDDLELIATLFDVVRVPPENVDSWL